MKAVFLSMDTNNKVKDYNKFLVQNTGDEETTGINEISDSELVNSIEQQDKIDNSALALRSDKTFIQCASAGNIYSKEELNEGLQEIIG